MSKYTIKRYEREMHISWGDDDRRARIFTNIPSKIRKLDALASEFPHTYHCICEDETNESKQYVVDARYIRFGKPMREDVREARRNRMKQMKFRKRRKENGQ